jgi:hypothetical protein
MTSLLYWFTVLAVVFLAIYLIYVWFDRRN